MNQGSYCEPSNGVIGNGRRVPLGGPGASISRPALWRPRHGADAVALAAAPDSRRPIPPSSGRAVVHPDPPRPAVSLAGTATWLSVPKAPRSLLSRRWPDLEPAACPGTRLARDDTVALGPFHSAPRGWRLKAAVLVVRCCRD